MGFTVKKRVLRRLLRRVSEKGDSRRCLERPVEEYAPLGVRPIAGKPHFLVMQFSQCCSAFFCVCCSAAFGKKDVALQKSKCCSQPIPP